MDRLTKRIDGGVERVCHHKADGSLECFACRKRTQCNAAIFERLAEYEDTGMTPAEFNFVKNFMPNATFSLAKAQGRLLVLPCCIGDPVYRIYTDCLFPDDCYTKRKCKGCEYSNVFIEKQAFCISMLSQNGKLEHPYYVSEEEARTVAKERY